MFSNVRFSPPHAGLLLLCAAWLLPGLVGHAPWKGGDSEHFVTLWQLQQHGFSAALTQPLYFAVATATAWLTSGFLDFADGARLASGVFVALALWATAHAARYFYGDAQAGWAAAFTLLGCIGLLVRGHELNPVTAALAAAALMLAGLAQLPHRRSGGVLLGGGAVLLLLTGRALETGALLTLAALTPLLFAEYRTAPARRALVWAIVGALGFTAGWLLWLETQGVPPAQALTLARWQGERQPGYYAGILGWYAWPAWPLALWALYRARRQARTAGVWLPALAWLGLMALANFEHAPNEKAGLLLLLPLALLGGAGLLSLRRGAANALLWFALMLFGTIGLLFWIAWSAHDLGTPARLARRLTKLGMTGVGEWRPWVTLLGVLVTLAWVGFLLRVERSPLRPMLVWTAGITFIWCLLMALFLAPLDRRLAYTSVAQQLVARVPAGECVQTHQVRNEQRLLLVYHSQRELIPADMDCRWLLVETRERGIEPHISPSWAKVWDGARPGDRSDRFHLYARRP